jgi:Bacterial tandem repeat domain 1
MNFSRRLALGYASALVATGGSTQLGIASVARQMGGALEQPIASKVQTAQRLHLLLVHRDEADGAAHFATLSAPSHDTAWMAVNTLDDRAYREAFDTYRLRGYRLRRVNAFATKKGTRYAAIWQLASGPDWKAGHDLTLADYQEKSNRLAARGYRLVHIDGSAAQSGPRYAAIWERSEGAAQQSFAALTEAQYRQTLASLTARGFQPRQISGYALHGEARFAAIFDKGADRGRVAHHRMTAAAFQNAAGEMITQGYRLIDASGYAIGGKPAISGVWEKA